MNQGLPCRIFSNMWHWKFRRAIGVLVALAFLAGMQLVAAPMSAVAFATAAASQPNLGSCKTCGDQNMAAGECSSICTNFQSFSGIVVFSMPYEDKQSWSWLSETIRSTAVQPDLSPPRS